MQTERVLIIRKGTCHQLPVPPLLSFSPLKIRYIIFSTSQSLTLLRPRLRWWLWNHFVVNVIDLRSFSFHMESMNIFT